MSKTKLQSKIESLCKMQVVNIEAIQKAFKLNLVMCPNCGESQFVGINTSEEPTDGCDPATQCYNCGMLIANDNSPDVFYREGVKAVVESVTENWNTEECPECGAEDQEDYACENWDRCDTCGTMICLECAEKGDAGGGVTICKECRNKAIREYLEKHQ